MTAPAMKQWLRCACTARHRTREAFLRCSLHDRQARVTGSGGFAAVCVKRYPDGRGGTTRWPIVHLFETRDGAEAYAASAFDGGHQCSGTCVLEHLLVALPGYLR